MLSRETDRLHKPPIRSRYDRPIVEQTWLEEVMQPQNTCKYLTEQNEQKRVPRYTTWYRLHQSYYSSTSLTTRDWKNKVGRYAKITHAWGNKAWKTFQKYIKIKKIQHLRVKAGGRYFYELIVIVHIDRNSHRFKDLLGFGCGSLERLRNGGCMNAWTLSSRNTPNSIGD